MAGTHIQDEFRERVRLAVRSDSFDRKPCTDLSAGINEEIAIGRPGRVDRILRDERSRVSIDGDSGDSRPGALIHGDSDRLPVRSPGRSTPNFNRSGQY